MNQQKIYNLIRKHLLTQGERAEVMQPNFAGDDSFFCQYRSYDPTRKKVLKCAVGCLIPFRNYDPSFEGRGVATSDVRNAIPPSLRVNSREDDAFLIDLQRIHDEYLPEDWADQLDIFAEQHGLHA